MPHDVAPLVSGYDTTTLTDPEMAELATVQPTAPLPEAPQSPVDLYDSDHVQQVVTDLGRATRTAQGFSRWSRRYVRSVAALDFLAATLITVLVCLTASMGTGTAVVWAPPVAALCWTIALLASHGYARHHVGVGADELRSVFKASIVIVVLVAIVVALTSNQVLLDLVLLTVPVAALASLAVRFGARRVLHGRQSRGKNLRRVIMIGSAHSAQELMHLTEREPHCGLQSVGVCVPSDDMETAHALGLPVLGTLADAAQVVRQNACDAVAVTSGELTNNDFLRRLAWSLEGTSVDLLVHPGLVEVAGPRMHIRPYQGLPLLQIDQPHFSGWRRIFKRIFDLVATSVGLLLISPVLLALAVAIKAHDRGPIIFRQRRVGIDGRPFTMYKFRSMCTDAEERLAQLLAMNEGAGPLFKLKADPRVTPIGRILRKYSLDELPQLFNVLTGEMSLVGPRPPLQTEVDEYGLDARRRLLVQPGVTGLWQVSGRSLLSWEETVRLDLRYVENWTLTFDLLILWKTVFAVVGQRGAY
ncbi:MAG: sugar transferase [Propionibacteriaceae bacterium]